MLHMFMGKEPWFRPKSFGIGISMPIRWQGWVLILSYLFAAIGLGRLAMEGNAATRGMATGLLLLVTTIFVILCRKRTEGGWRWRWGGGR